MRFLLLCAIVALATPGASAQVAHLRAVPPTDSASGNDADPSALAQQVMLETARSADSDLHEMLSALQQESQRRRQMRDATQSMRERQQALNDQLRADRGLHQSSNQLASNPCIFADYHHLIGCLRRVSSKLAQVTPSQRRQLDAELTSLRSTIEASGQASDQQSFDLQDYQDALSQTLSKMSEVERRIGDVSNHSASAAANADRRQGNCLDEEAEALHQAETLRGDADNARSAADSLGRDATASQIHPTISGVGNRTPTMRMTPAPVSRAGSSTSSNCPPSDPP